jgi:hypothetical protein
VTKTFELNEAGLAAFYATPSEDTYMPVEATITAFSFVRLFKDRVQEVITGNTYQLKQISLARNNTDKIDADKRCQALKAAGTVRGTTDSSGYPSSPADTGVAEPVQYLSAVSEAEYPAREPDSLVGEGTTIRIHAGGAI